MSDYLPDNDGKCPHCQRHVRFKNTNESEISHDGGKIEVYKARLSGAHWNEGDTRNYIVVYSCRCPSCNKPIISMDVRSNNVVVTKLIFPLGLDIRAPNEVPRSISRYYNEAIQVLPISEGASAALSRRCLDRLLGEQGHLQTLLNDKLQAAANTLPTYIGKNLDAMVKMGEDALQDEGNDDRSLIPDVSPAEAHLLIHVLDQLFDHYYVKPAEDRRHTDALGERIRTECRKPLSMP